MTTAAGMSTAVRVSLDDGAYAYVMPRYVCGHWAVTPALWYRTKSYVCTHMPTGAFFSVHETGEAMTIETARDAADALTSRYHARFATSRLSEAKAAASEVRAQIHDDVVDARIASAKRRGVL